MRDREKAKARARRYRERQKVKRFGPEAAGKDLRGTHDNYRTGERHPRWNGGRWRHPDGYIGIRVPEGHHLRQAHGYAFEHHLVVEEMLGRRLRDDEEVHHRNGVKNDNRPENLQVLLKADHAREHAEASERDHLGRFVPDKPRRVQELP